jgi:hypothetical protein
LERAQDRDGLHIDLFEIAERMLKFAEDNVVWREKHNGEEPDSTDNRETESDLGGGAPIESESSSTSGLDELGDSERMLADNDVRDIEESQEEVKDVLDVLEQNLGILASDTVVANLMLEPLSGEHLKAVKRLAGYFRLRWTEQGSGKCRRLILHVKSGPQPPAETNAAEELISKYKKIENGVTTKRLPTARCTPQVSGTQV